MAKLEGRSGVEIPDEPEGTCGICHHESPECLGTRHICNACHTDGWREGKEMMQAFRDDPQFTISDDGQIGIAGKGMV